MLSTNDRIIKLWKFEYKTHREASKCTIGPDGQLMFPQSSTIDEGYESIERK